MPSMDTTIWRGVEIHHPVDWELSVASAPGEVGRCRFTDRYWQRLEVMWRRLDSRPDPKVLLEKFRHEHLQATKVESSQLHPLTDAPQEWHGFVQSRPRGSLVRALRLDVENHLLFEITVLWPDRRNTTLEREILNSIAALPTDTPTRRWRAMGLDVTLEDDYDLPHCELTVGRIHWEFLPSGKGSKGLMVERIAMPDVWLTGSLANWMPRQLPIYSTVLSQQARTINGHPGQELLSRSRAGRLGSVSGRHNIRLEWGWICPTEHRMYRICMTDVSRRETLELPPSLVVRCCQPSGNIPDRPEVGSPAPPPPADAAEGTSTGPVSTRDFLAAVPHLNQAMTLDRQSPKGPTARVEIPRPWYLVPPISWILPFGKYRQIQLDAIGVELLDLCDGRRPIENIIEIFAANHKLTFREAQLPVTQYLRKLTQRGILAIVGGGDAR
ncbi:MAG TPA: PqqD family protein [Phycisphaerae bacterium]|nr:PqqD family protein [Phycisphaerae bacterium]HDZ43618.1 PqqD family protein [Phycisphaerae bacterium]